MYWSEVHQFGGLTIAKKIWILLVIIRMHFLPFFVCGWNGNGDFWYCQFSLFQAHYGVKKSQNRGFDWEIFFWLVQKNLSLQFRWYLEIILNSSPPEFLFFIQICLSYFYLLEIKVFLVKFAWGWVFFHKDFESKWLKINSPYVICQHVFFKI
jgi:hypothetical protein